MITIFIVFVINFILIHIAPGDPVSVMMGKDNNDPELRAALMEKYGLDKPLYVQFYRQLIRANESELQKMDETGEQNPEKRAALQKAFDIAVQAHKEMTDELEREIHYQVVPIRKLVYIQLACGLLTAEYLKEHY